MNYIKKGLTTYIGLIGFLVAFLMPLLSAIAGDDPTPFGLTQKTWMVTGVIFAALAMSSRYAQAVLDYLKNPLPVGSGVVWRMATYLGLAGGLAGILGPMITELADTTSSLGVSPKTWFLAGEFLLAVTGVGRAFQAFANRYAAYKHNVVAGDLGLGVVPVGDGDEVIEPESTLPS